MRVAEGATWHSLLRTVPPIKSPAAGREGVVTDMASDGDLYVEWARPGIGDWASSEFCTLIEPEPEPVTPAPSAMVRVVYLDDPERQIFEAASSRLARELAAMEKTDEPAALKKILVILNEHAPKYYETAAVTA